MSATNPLPPLAASGRFDYQAIGQRPDYRWPKGARLAVYLGFNVEHFAFGRGLGAKLGPASPEPDVLNYAWREYGNRVGAWRCLDLFDELALPTGALINTALYDHCPELVQALLARGDELIGHGHSNAMRQSDLSEADERALLAGCRQRILERSGTAPAGWLSPWISETLVTPDLLAETGYGYTLNWCHDDQPIRMRTRSGQTLWSIPYPQEVNDIPMVMGRLMDGRAFGELITDHFDEMRRQAARQPLVMGIALHPYIVGQPHRLLHLRTALEHLVRARDAGDVWFTTPGQIYQHMLSIHP
jgi:peptidoglycan/xylan/chitin deacetylase (PgdA/CDA1 family)